MFGIRGIKKQSGKAWTRVQGCDIKQQEAWITSNKKGWWNTQFTWWIKKAFKHVVTTKESSLKTLTWGIKI